jgi:hypothetical protein
MIRGLIVTIMLVASLAGASAQPLFNPATPVVPVPAPPPTPPAATPGMAPPPAVIGRDSRSDQGAATPNIQLGSPARETHNDRSIRCVQQGTALGIPSGAMGQYVRECVNSP